MAAKTVQTAIDALKKAGVSEPSKIPWGQKNPNNMTQEETEEFAKLIVHRIRDIAIRNSDNILHAVNANGPSAKRWAEAKQSKDFSKFGESIIVDCIDEAIFHFLSAVDGGVISITFNSSNGKTVPLSKKIIGELGGWYMGFWRDEYSTERVPPDLDNLSLP